jgi:enoyl-CoA hydratase
MEFKNLIVEKKDGIAILKFNRPKALNALNSETLVE